MSGLRILAAKPQAPPGPRRRQFGAIGKASKGCASSHLKWPVFASISSRRWMVRASSLVLSLSRFAACREGTERESNAFCLEYLQDQVHERSLCHTGLGG